MLRLVFRKVTGSAVRNVTSDVGSDSALLFAMEQSCSGLRCRASLGLDERDARPHTAIPASQLRFRISSLRLGSPFSGPKFLVR